MIFKGAFPNSENRHSKECPTTRRGDPCGRPSYFLSLEGRGQSLPVLWHEPRPGVRVKSVGRSPFRVTKSSEAKLRNHNAELSLRYSPSPLKGYDGGYRSASKNLFYLFNLSYYLGTAQELTFNAHRLATKRLHN